MFPLVIFLKNRNQHLIEWMDKPDADPELLSNTYLQFDRINKLLSGWDKIYREYIKPIIRSSATVSILDIGCGGGDIIRYLYELSRNDGFETEFTGIDPDRRSIEFVTKSEWPEGVTFYAKKAEDLVKEEQAFDIVISNHLMHHLKNDQLTSMCRVAAQLAKKRVLFSDIERNAAGYLCFQLAAPLLFRNSYIVEDGLISIKKSFRKSELEPLLPGGWSVQRKFPFRLVATLSKTGA